MNLLEQRPQELRRGTTGYLNILPAAVALWRRAWLVMNRIAALLISNWLRA